MSIARLKFLHPKSVALQQVFLEAQRESRPLKDPLGGPLTPWGFQGIQHDCLKRMLSCHVHSIQLIPDSLLMFRLHLKHTNRFYSGSVCQSGAAMGGHKTVAKRDMRACRNNSWQMH